MKRNGLWCGRYGWRSQTRVLRLIPCSSTSSTSPNGTRRLPPTIRPPQSDSTANICASRSPSCWCAAVATPSPTLPHPIFPPHACPYLRKRGHNVIKSCSAALCRSTWPQGRMHGCIMHGRYAYRHSRKRSQRAPFCPRTPRLPPR